MPPRLLIGLKNHKNGRSLSLSHRQYAKIAGLKNIIRPSHHCNRTRFSTLLKPRS